MNSYPWWINSLIWMIGHALILIGAGIVVWKWRSRRPKAARLVLLAIGIDGLSIGLLLVILYVQLFVLASDRGLTINQSGPDLSDPQVILVIVRQIARTGCDIAAWSLIAWAILMRPDERRRTNTV